MTAPRSLTWQWKSQDLNLGRLAPQGGHQIGVFSLTAMPRIDRWITQVCIQNNLQRMHLLANLVVVMQFCPLPSWDMLQWQISHSNLQLHMHYNLKHFFHKYLLSTSSKVNYCAGYNTIWDCILRFLMKIGRDNKQWVEDSNIHDNQEQWLLDLHKCEGRSINELDYSRKISARSWDFIWYVK